MLASCYGRQGPAVDVLEYGELPDRRSGSRWVEGGSQSILLGLPPGGIDIG